MEKTFTEDPQQMQDQTTVKQIFRELHSEQVHEIINQPPPWLVRWGISLFFVLLISILAMAWIIKYPDVVNAKFTLISMESPRTLVVPSEGKLVRILARDGQTVSRGTNLAFWESTADHQQIINLSKDIALISVLVNKRQWDQVKNLNVLKYDKLGELQTDFQTFTQQFLDLKSYLPGGYYAGKRSLLLRDAEDLRQLHTNLSEQLRLQKKDYDLAKDEFAIQEKLYKAKVIAALELKKEEGKLLLREMPLQNTQSSVVQNRSFQTANEKELLELDNAVVEHRNSFVQAVYALASSIDTWKRKYILTAPIDGRLSFSAPWQPQQHMSLGQEFITIEPYNNHFQGLVKIGQVNIGKIETGQKVLIKLDGYPYREYGLLEGSLSKLSRTPGQDSVYWGYVQLPHQLTTRYGRKVVYRSKMSGSADIVTSDRPFLERLLSLIRRGRG